MEIKPLKINISPRVYNTPAIPMPSNQQQPQQQQQQNITPAPTSSNNKVLKKSSIKIVLKH